MHTLILGGTREARDLAALLIDASIKVTSSLAGRVANPALPKGEVRIGGFGGAVGLAAWLREHQVDVIVDATHPFAEKISQSAALAAANTGLPIIALHRPAWMPEEADKWISALSMAAAAQLCQGREDTVFLSIGRQNLPLFADLDNQFLIRCVEPPAQPLPINHQLVLSRGPFSFTDERELMLKNNVRTLVTKNSGGELTYAKIRAARDLGIEVVMIQRPELPAVDRVVHSAAAAFNVCCSVER